MNKKTIYSLVGAGIIILCIILFFVFKPKNLPTPAPLGPVIEPTLGPVTTLEPEPIPKNPLEDAYFMSKKMNKDTENIKNKLCKTLNAKTIFPDICT